MNRRIASIVVAVISAVCLNGVALAQTGPQGQVPQGQPAVNPPAANPPAVVMGGLSEDALANMIKALDPSYKVQATSDNKGKIYTFTVVRDGWSYLMRVTVFSNDIWLESALGRPVSNGANVQAGVLAKLLQTNFDIGPAHFAFVKATNSDQVTLYLCKLLDRRLTAEEFNYHLDNFLKIIRNTYPVWSGVGTAA